MEGLEIIEVSLKNLMLDNEKFRLDNEFFQKEFISAYELIKSKPSILFGSIIENLTDYHANGSYENLSQHVSILDKPDYAYMVRSTDLEKLDFESDVKYVTETAYNFLTKTKLFGGELLINKIGNPGVVYVMPKLNKPATVGMNLFMVRLKSNSGFNERFLWAFFNGALGKKIITRKVNGTVPLTIDKEAVRSLYLPKVSKKFQDGIEEIVLFAEAKLANSRRMYVDGETLLLDTLGMADFSPDTETVNIKSFKDSFAATGRLDAEYYQPKYEQVMAHITEQAHDSLSALVTMKKSIEPGSDEYSDDEQGLPFMRVADYSKFGVTPPQKKIKASFVAENKDKLDALMPKAGTILFSKDGSVGEAYCLREDADFITSGAVLHLTVRDTKKLLPDYLTLALNSKLVKMQAERDAGGSIILHWRVGEIESVVVPLVDMPTQQKIAALVQQSFTLKAESEHLLAVAKRAVEMAIEQDEAAAMAYLEACAGMVTAPTKGKVRSLSDFDPALMLKKKK